MSDLRHDERSSPSPKSEVVDTATLTEASPDHPHGPADPRWIDDEGRCVLCGRDYWQGQARSLEADREEWEASARSWEASAIERLDRAVAVEAREKALSEALELIAAEVTTRPLNPVVLPDALSCEPGTFRAADIARAALVRDKREGLRRLLAEHEAKKKP